MCASFDLVTNGLFYLHQACRKKEIGPFQLEAAIQSAHCNRRYSGKVDWSAIVNLYDVLVRIGPTLSIRIGQAAAIAENGDPSQALSLLSNMKDVMLLPTAKT